MSSAVDRDADGAAAPRTVAKRRRNVTPPPPVRDPVVCRAHGPTVTIGKTVLESTSGLPLYLTRMSDYTLVSDCEFTEFVKFAPASLKAVVRDNWHYLVHVSPTVRVAVTRAALRARVIGGEILAYQYSECSIEGNDCVYYGFLPTERQNIADTHKRCLLSAMQVWPRKLYVYARRESACMCSPGCSLWSFKVRDCDRERRFCIKRVPWNEVYIMMGDLDETCVEEIKEPRQCAVCAQCIKCANSPVYCRSHRRCKHKRVQTLHAEMNIPLSVPEMKSCKRVSRVK